VKVIKLIKKYKIGNILFFSFTAFVTILLFAVIAVNYYFSTTEIEHNTTTYQRSLLIELNKRLNLQMNALQAVSLAGSRNEMIIPFLKGDNDPYTMYTLSKELTRYFSNIVYSMPSIHSVDFFMNKPPAYDSQSPVHFININQLRKESWYSNIDNSDFSWSPEHTIETYKGKVQVISFVRKIYSQEGDNLGYLLFNVNAADIQRLIEGEDTNFNRILLGSGNNLITSVGNLNKNDTLSISKLIKKNANQDSSSEGHFRFKKDFIVWSSSINSDWLLIEVTPWNYLSSGTQKMIITLIAIGILLIIMSTFFISYFSKRLMFPLQLLISRMKAYPSFENEKPLPTDYKNEYGQLFNGYQLLLNRINELHQSMEERLTKQKEAELEALQANINPHFLYNTLDQLNWMAIEEGQDRISQVLELMGRMFRIGLSNGKSFIRIEDEIEHVKSYLKIQQIRLGESLSFHIDVDHTILDFYMPKITLQPFIENAIIHGFHNINLGTINIIGKMEGKDILFYIIDDGIGIDGGWENIKPKNKGGYGIKNVKERISAYFGKEYGITITGIKGKGTKVVIKIPAITEELKEKEKKNVENSNY
jgi:two-component system sensor histidine kinase YesM